MEIMIPWIRARITFVIVATAALLAACAPLARQDLTPPLRSDDYFPGASWRSSTPESQGIDSAVLVEMFEAIAARQLPIHSLQLVRHGHLVVDAYFHPFAAGRRHDIASVTKSVTTTLIGQALDRGDLPGLEASVWPLLGVQQPDDARKGGITLRHLLTTSSGLECSNLPYEREMLAMAQAPSWVEFALAIPMRETPGTRFSYCSPGFHLLSALMTRRGGANAEQFAREHLFGPLGITDVVWPRDAQGHSQGAGDLQMRPTDMAKIGYLFLRGGNWAGRQLVSRAWIEQATRRQVSAGPTQDYGFGWWISRDMPGMFEANGRGGQRIVVWPARNVVLVTTGGGFEPGELAAFLVRALKSDASLPAHPRAAQALKERIDAAARAPLARHLPVQGPPRAAAIDGVRYRLDANPLALRTLLFRNLGAAEAHVELAGADWQLTIPVGMDGVFRQGSDARSGEPVAARARWLGPDELLLEIDTIARINFFTLRLAFADEAVRIQLAERAGLMAGEVLGQPVRP